jgi:hypothetical protein
VAGHITERSRKGTALDFFDFLQELPTIAFRFLHLSYRTPTQSVVPTLNDNFPTAKYIAA